ncbi:M56 family metallopeptidase [Mucilaginibacter sp. FT3.2]|uniref:M56 family metallopeptidase n=1 Tax=Mucilaginibacter sp. FT3.2 TaxID=2723090 RepID=UPI00162268FA|nr:M56 family metallopeptidase [Mucilaginibacter sp. FT3.2]MBB6229600.1 outer membrane biosynthesis protein TonB [Mucilaginibacter sp. FT3.2]
MNWLHYLLEANIYLAVFYAGYCLFLNKETHYTLNRVYLLLSCIISFILPVIQVGALKPADAVVQQTYVTIAPAASNAAASPIVNYKLETAHITLQDAVWYAYLTGIAVLSLLLFIKIIRLLMMTSKAKTLAGNQYKLVGLSNSNTAFSFFNYLFIGTKTSGSELIIRHELVHIRQKHSIDILFIELLRIINWFNPIIYLIQMSVKTVHEYIADEQTATQATDALSYSSFLVDNAYGISGSSITHSFFNHNLLKKRIIMLNQKRSGNLARLKYLVAVPICAGMLCASTLAFSKNYALVDLIPNGSPSTPQINTKGSVLAQPRLTKTRNIAVPSTEPVFNDLAKFIAKTTLYPKVARENNIQGDVFAVFNVNENHKINGAKIVGGIEYGCGQDVIEKLPSFSQPINVQPGIYKLKISFSLANDAEYNENNPAPATSAKAAPFTADLEIVIVGYGLEKAGAPGSILQSQLRIPVPPPAINIKQTDATPAQPDLAIFYKYLAQHIRYPAVDFENRIGGRLIASFDVVGGKITDPQIVRGLEPAMEGEILRVIKNYDDKLDLKDSHYVIPVSFQLVDSKNNQVAHLPQANTTDKQKATVDKPVKQANSFSTAVSLDEVVIVGYAKD